MLNVTILLCTNLPVLILLCTYLPGKSIREVEEKPMLQWKVLFLKCFKFQHVMKEHGKKSFQILLLYEIFTT